MKLKSLLLSALMMLSAGSAWADVVINETNFPDENFRSYLLGRGYGSDGMLTNKEIAEVTFIGVSSRNIQSLKGIEYFTALRWLECYSNQLTSLDVSGCTALRTLCCYNNQLTSLDVSGCTALWYLECQNNQLTSLDVSKNTELKGLYCYDNQIKGKAMDALVASLPTVSSGTGTMQVICYENEQNEMTTTQVAAAKAKGWIPYYTDGEKNEYNDYIWKECPGVDPSTTGIAINEENFPDANFRSWLLNQSYGNDGVLTNTEIAGVALINISSKGIRSLEGIEYFIALTYLYCDNNQLTSLDVSKNIFLERLDCDYNQLASLDVSKNTYLKSLRCSGNKLTSLDLSQNPALSILDCYQNQIKGTAMDALVESLPFSYNCSMWVVFNVNEGNVMTTSQIAAAKAKGWTPCYYDGINWLEYPGVDPSTGVNSVEASDADDSAPWYTINGVQLQGKPTAAGIYIHGGRKVVVR